MLDTHLRCLDAFLRRGDIFEDRSSCIAYTMSARRPHFDGLSSGNLTFSQHVHHAAALVDSDSLTMQNVADKDGQGARLAGCIVESCHELLTINT